MSTYAGKSYWLATYNWENQNYPVDTRVYIQSGGFSNGYVPLFVIVGYKNKVYWDHNSDGFRGALRQAIDEIVAEGVWVKNPVADKVLLYGESQDIDVSTVFADIDNNPISVSIVSNENRDIVSAELNGNVITITANGNNSGSSMIVIRGAAGEFDETDQFEVNVFDPDAYYIEDFETGDFSRIPWKFSGNAEWVIDSASPFEGSFCSGSEDISDNQRADMTVNIDYVVSGNVSFQYKISSEGNYDFLKFYIDGVEKGKWSGITSWKEVSFPVTTGTHNFSWSYQKDSSASYGNDRAWVDRIVFEGGVYTSIEPELSGLIDNFKLYQNYPNPFNPVTDISFSLNTQNHVKLTIFNQKGQLVDNLINKVLNRGLHQVKFDASDLNSGIYYYTLTIKDRTETKKMILIK
ncbi:MAG: T9SS type A sorting domain-containing protein [Candidatus Delongbacteria bacterium]|nr:T9SS type A sorting domain-containing protein [Candidatus Delongbacteria bacterium]